MCFTGLQPAFSSVCCASVHCSPLTAGTVTFGWPGRDPDRDRASLLDFVPAAGSCLKTIPFLYLRRSGRGSPTATRPAAVICCSGRRSAARSGRGRPEPARVEPDSSWQTKKPAITAAITKASARRATATAADRRLPRTRPLPRRRRRRGGRGGRRRDHRRGGRRAAAAAAAGRRMICVAESVVAAETARAARDALEIGLHLVGALVPLVRVLRERAHHDHVELARDVRAQLSRAAAASSRDASSRSRPACRRRTASCR